jgi:CheY-like chemotaxis protein
MLGPGRNRDIATGIACAGQRSVHDSKPMQSSGNHPRRHRLLVAEDDQALREMIVLLLGSDGHSVIAVANGVDLLDTLEVSVNPDLGSEKFDLVISDIRMPGRTGLSVFSQLGYGPTIPPVVFITAFGDEELHEQAHHAGALAVLDKPIDIDELRVFVNNFLVGKGD